MQSIYRSTQNQYFEIKHQTYKSVGPMCKKVKKEKDYFWSEFDKTLIRQDNFAMRQNVTIYGSFLLFGASFFLLKKGYLRYSLRNAVMFYFISSYFICP